MASYQPVTKEIVEQLEKIAPGRVYFGDDVNPDYGRDEMPIYGIRMPEASAAGFRVIWSWLPPGFGSVTVWPSRIGTLRLPISSV